MQNIKNTINGTKLTYWAWNNSSVTRGVLQTTLDNGDITEQDVEYESYLGGWGIPKYVLEEMRVLSDG